MGVAPTQSSAACIQYSNVLAGNDHSSLHAAMQGMEKDIIVLTTAVTKPTAFAADPQRLNVAITRAKHHLILIGCDPALQASSICVTVLLPAQRHLRHAILPQGPTGHA